ncbi:hypothetical protein TREMEDRAFT_58305 [Tremella mesenterica DSM 1558]|uniref:uncharacterized protein n=1 Tax=Tremella mesenterica (strain ATCC 24925 / CBS 8224 / DSM 1558 / NBRC 9311 / NRRL Y-6157 / RJB 2259-6 / UBC 559-6) TaxID=578456 RepID=UPI0003F48C04|nr:uncharacterized protein TREMEDRAFT_58305 [Tremella mesenterica DSM 1558]EIW72149.1 hypothetical protein TREMEDRAFT_58305 [Tremella mesenterica DSM 1558]
MSSKGRQCELKFGTWNSKYGSLIACYTPGWEAHTSGNLPTSIHLRDQEQRSEFKSSSSTDHVTMLLQVARCIVLGLSEINAPPFLSYSNACVQYASILYDVEALRYAAEDVEDRGHTNLYFVYLRRGRFGTAGFSTGPGLVPYFRVPAPYCDLAELEKEKLCLGTASRESRGPSFSAPSSLPLPPQPPPHPM